MPWGLIGLDLIKKSFSDMLGAGRIPHAILLSGPLGSGKFSLSMALAQALNCEQPDPDFSPCLKCLSCRKSVVGEHPDLIVLEPKGKLNTLPIDDIRELKSTLTFRPYEGRYKVAIIRGAHYFREDSGGALLKTLEEPTPNTVIILNAISEAAVMTTLVSRCIRFKVPPLNRELILDALTKRGLEGELASLLAGLCGGTLGEALSLEPEVVHPIWFGIDRLLGEYGEIQANKAAIDWTKEIASEVEKLGKKDTDGKAKASFLALIISCLRLWWRDAAVLASTADVSLMQGPAPSDSQLKLAKTITAFDIQKQEKALAILSDNLNRPIRFELVFENYWLDVLKSYSVK
jgi:DNA polymerase-3 subunit delta'